MNGFQDLLALSLEQKKGVVLYLNGQTLSGVVTAISEEGILELRSREFSRMLVRLDRIDAVATV